MTSFFIKHKNTIITYVAVFVICYITFHTFQPVNIAGESMEGTLHNNDLVIKNTYQYNFTNPQRGDIIIIKTDYNNSEHIVKRIIGLPEDKITITSDRVYVNDKKSNEDFTKDGFTTPENEIGTQYTVPKNKYFVMGDNRQYSADSRTDEIGYVDKSQIEGKVILRIYPLQSFGKIRSEKII